MSMHDDLMQAFIDQTLSVDEADTLNRNLRDDDEALEQFIVLNHLHTLLHERMHTVQGSGFIIQEQTPSPMLSDSVKPSPKRWGSLLAAAVLALAATAWFFLPHENPAPNPVIDHQQSQPVALLTNLDDAVFIDTPTPPAIGGELPPGELRLKSGRAQVMFKSGAVVDLIGPAEFYMVGPNHGRLTAGVFEAFVPEPARGFTIDLPHAMRIIDLGTRFRIDMADGADHRMRVTEGTVQLIWPNGQRTLTAGYQCVLRPDGPGDAVPVKILAMKPNDTRGPLSTTTTALTPDSAPAAADNDNAWGFSAANEQAQLGAGSFEVDALAGQVWVARNDLGENPPRLTTVIAGLDDARRYNIYVYYITHTLQHWQLRAGRTGDVNKSLIVCDDSGAQLASGGNSDELRLRRRRVLTDAVPAAGSISIDIDDAGMTYREDVRGFYKGIGIEISDKHADSPTPADQTPPETRGANS
ncbi:FecR domain-containing protein [Planctomycetales bacterium ZRK34]|nr:FecR domain-containing protein [Planctomycetales bacterium ZRK34]